jgi:hypothetical protein
LAGCSRFGMAFCTFGGDLGSLVEFDAELHHLDVGVTGNHVALRPPLGLGGYPLLFRAGDASCLKLIVSVAIEILDGCFGGLADL